MKILFGICGILLLNACRQVSEPEEKQSVVLKAERVGISDTGVLETDSSSYSLFVDGIDPMPEFEGNFNQYLLENIDFSNASKDLGGRIVVNFIVDTDGNVKNAKIEKGVDSTFDAEVLRVVQNSPKWKPVRGVKNPYDWHFRVPVRILPVERN